MPRFNTTQTQATPPTSAAGITASEAHNTWRGTRPSRQVDSETPWDLKAQQPRHLRLNLLHEVTDAHDLLRVLEHLEALRVRRRLTR